MTQQKLLFPEVHWPVGDDKRKDHVTLHARDISPNNDPEDKVVFDKVTFIKCDFEGDFTNYTPTFKGCKFDFL